MHFNNAAFLSVLAGVAPLLARADDLELDRDDIPAACTSICEPVRSLAQTCDVDDDRIRDDRTEDLLNLQCVCTNNSFDVARYAALCQSCMTQNTRDTSDLEDINKIMRDCGFATQSYAASQSNDAASVTVQATRPTDSAQLTTTFVPGVGGSASGSSSATRNGSSGTSGTTTTSGSTTAATGSSQPGATTSAAGNSGSMASTPLPQGGVMAVGFAAVVAVFGSMLLL